MRKYWAGALVVASLALAGCGAGQGATHIRPDALGPNAQAWQGRQYVALGDSYTAGPGIGGITAVSGRKACQQSDENYPHLVAARLQMKLKDVSCSGAQTGQMKGSQDRDGVTVPPQFDALSSATGVVTVGIGANDEQMFMKLIYGCVVVRDSHPHGAPCQKALRSTGVSVAGLQHRLTRRLAKVYRGIQRRAPHARVLAIGYPQIVPAHGHCAALPFATGDYAFARSVIVAFNDAMRAAARRTDVTYVDTWSSTAGHDICAHDPWIAGSSAGRAGAPYHPYAEEMQAVAADVVKVLAS